MPDVLSIPLAPNEPHEWVLHFEAPAQGAYATEVLNQINDFAVLASKGAFAFSEAPSSMVVTSRTVKDQQASLTVSVANCDPRYARVLRYFAKACGVSLNVAIGDVDILPSRRDARIVTLVPKATEQLVMAGGFYPPIAASFTRLVRRTSVRENRSRHVMFHLHDEPPSEQINLLGQLVQDWGGMALGAYPISEEGFDAGNEYVLNAEGSQHDPSTYEVVVEEFLAAEEAFNSLINVIGAELMSCGKLQSITID